MPEQRFTILHLSFHHFEPPDPTSAQMVNVEVRPPKQAVWCIGFAKRENGSDPFRTDTWSYDATYEFPDDSGDPNGYTLVPREEVETTITAHGYSLQSLLALVLSLEQLRKT